MKMGSVALYICSVLIASCSQILLKISANRTYPNRFREYWNVPVVTGYGLLAVSMLLTMIAYRGVPLSFGPVIEALGYVFVGILGYVFLREKLTGRKLAGMFLIIAGIIIIQTAG